MFWKDPSGCSAEDGPEKMRVLPRRETSEEVIAAVKAVRPRNRDGEK